MKTLTLSPDDNVTVLLEDSGSIKKGHKIALAKIKKGEAIIKYGHLIGVALYDIKEGDHVHIHNVSCPTNLDDNQALNVETISAIVSENRRRVPTTFMGYKRSHGVSGVRNYVVVLSTVNCSATVVRRIADQAKTLLKDRPDIHDIVPVIHSQGCAQALGGLGHLTLNQTLAGWLLNPNVVGALVVGLGCEGTTLKSILDSRSVSLESVNMPLEHFNTSELGGTIASIEEGVLRLKKIIKSIPKQTRSEQPVSDLRIALNCGGSDSFSGLTANPTLGVASDLLVSNGGTVALAEIPECHGAEGLLAARCASEQVRLHLDEMFKFWKEYSLSHHVELNNNLAPGNIAGGITTILEKSLGAVMKGGTTTINDVYSYAQEITSCGLVIMNTPGFDPVSMTGLAAGDCQIGAFTTGRGSAYGCAIMPTLKISTNNEIFKKLSKDIDFDASVVLDQGSLPDVGADLYCRLIRLASGEQSFSEQYRMGADEFSPWQIGETL